jgi:hypothetical protein
VTRREGNVAIANFVGETANEGLGRFLPYLLFPDVEYAVHVLPKAKGMATVSCGINPWNKPKTGDRAEKHLGNYFAAHFGGGGHAFVAGGKIQEADVAEIDRLIDFIRA